MPWFRWLWLLHRWIGVAAGLLLLLSAGTGLLLLVKKDYAWLQPPMMKAEAGDAAALQPLQKVYEAVFALGLPEFRSEADIDRIDFRPAKRVHKVVSVHDHQEVQVCAITLRTSGPNPRRSDWLEQLHDGSWFGGFAHAWLMPLAALALLYLGVSGYVMWLWPKWQRRRKRRLHP
ncbi:MAG: hypothetical protein RL398_3159 [Planctomycetota bacterium]|jgi:uncharacterized iron-regulated membrane protein